MRGRRVGAWDPTWEAATSRDSLGWTAELRIPLSQLRFPNAASQTWGINFYRYVQRKDESDYWAYSSQTDQGYASFFGHLLGLQDLPQPRRLELLPYATGVAERIDPGVSGNPFNDVSREVGRFGLDLKYGLTSNLTLAGTVNPDFGQVEADPAEVNLTAYETYFSERRPFFVEGADIFSTVLGPRCPVVGRGHPTTGRRHHPGTPIASRNALSRLALRVSQHVVRLVPFCNADSSAQER